MVLVALRVEICFAFNVNEISLMYITLYIIGPICNAKELIMDKPYKECGIVGCKLVYQAATVELIQ